jgi:UDP-sugar pyrophosphorylase
VDEFEELESFGRGQIGRCGFVLVAGGLGERLGYNLTNCNAAVSMITSFSDLHRYSGIKIALPSETLTGTSYIELYCQQIKAIQDRYGGKLKLPFAIMTSDDTHSRTESLLRESAYFGLEASQVTLMKQEKVAALLDNEAHMALLSPYELDSKPHGHGDVHLLMHSTHTAASWAKQGVKWVAFFQDTNGLAFLPLCAALGVSAKLDLEVNSMAVPRKAKQAVGAVTRLVNESGREMTVNVEYNQLDPLLRAT